jgi:hypothetical protein
MTKDFECPIRLTHYLTYTSTKEVGMRRERFLTFLLQLHTGNFSQVRNWWEYSGKRLRKVQEILGEKQSKIRTTP